MKKKMIALLMALAVIPGLMTGCGTAEKPEQTPMENLTEDASAKNYEGVELTYWTMWEPTEPRAQVIQKAVNDFEAQTGIKVRISWKGRDLNKMIGDALEAEEKIDLFDEDFSRIAKEYAQYTADLTEMVEAAGFTGYSCINDQVTEWAGKLNSVCMAPEVGGVFYNMAAFAKAGIEKTPETWEDFLETSKKLKDAGIAPLAMDASNADFAVYYHLVRHLGEKRIAELSEKSGWAKEADAVKAAQEIIDYVNAGYMAEGAPDQYPMGQNKLGSGEAAMIISTNAVTEEINNIFGIQEWGMFAYPSVDDGADNVSVYAGANSIAVTSYSENKQAAFDFIMLLTTGAIDQEMVNTAGTIPCDPQNVSVSLPGAVETLTEGECAMTRCEGIKEELMPDFKALAEQLYSGKFQSGKAFCIAMDALY